MKSAFSRWQRTLSTLIVGVLSLQMLAACQGEADPMEKGLRETVEALQAEGGGRAERARALESSLNEQKNQLMNFPRLEGSLDTENPQVASDWVLANRERILTWFGQLDSRAAETRAALWSISKESFEARDEQVVARDAAVLTFALSVQRKISETVVRQATPLMLALNAEKIRNESAVKAMREDAMKLFLSHVGATVVAQNDVKVLLATLSSLRKEGRIPGRIADALDQAAQAQKSRLQAGQDSLAKMNREDRAKMDSELAGFRKSLEGASYLYRPGQNRYAVLNFLIVIGNLTWGSVNTLIGAGIVAAAMVVSPFTSYVEFPTFGISMNQKQIYVNVSGMSPFAGKMSMGLFELDNHAGMSFASDHEGVHALQSALFGPFYIPVVLASYLVAGFDQGFMEDWANAWASWI